MTQSYYPFNTGGGSTVLQAQWQAMAALWRSTGVITSYLNDLQVYADASGMWVKTKTGAAWMAGHYYLNDAEVTLAIAASDPTNPRLDRIVIHLDWSANTVALLVLTGTPAASPSVPALTQSASVWEISLATVLVSATVVNIAANKVTDDRQYSWPARQADNTFVYPTSTYQENLTLQPLATNTLRVPASATSPVFVTVAGNLCMATANVDLAAGAISGGANTWYVFANRAGMTFTLTASTSSAPGANQRLIATVYWDGANLSYPNLFVYPPGKPGVYYARVNRTAAQSISNTTTTAVSWDTEEADTDNLYTGGSPTRVTITHAGIYVVTTTAQLAASGAYTLDLGLRLNGATQLAAASAPGVAAVISPHASLTLIRHFIAADYLETTLWHNQGGAINTAAPTSLTVTALSA